MFQAEDKCDQNLIGWLKESKAFIMPSGTAFKNHLEIQYLLETATSCYGQSLLVAYWYLEASSLRPYKVNQKNICMAPVGSFRCNQARLLHWRWTKTL